jgi:auxin efflux carrier (AEC)
VTFLALAEVIGRVLALAGIGVVLRKAGMLQREDAKKLNALIIYVALPALVFRAVHGAELDVSLLLVAVVGWVALLAAFGAAWLWCRGCHTVRPTTGGFLIAASLGNTGYLGYPLSLALLGDEGLVRAIFYDQFATVLAVLTIGLGIAHRMGTESDGRTNPVKEIVTFPGLIALVLAFVLRPFAVPGLVSDVLEALSGLVVPLIMISLGLSLEVKAIRRNPSAIGALAGIKLVLAPLVAWGIGSLLLEDPEAVRLVVLEAGMPSMLLSLVFGLRYGLDADFISSAILVTTLGALVTVPLFQLLLA